MLYFIVKIVYIYIHKVLVNILVNNSSDSALKNSQNHGFGCLTRKKLFWFHVKAYENSHFG